MNQREFAEMIVGKPGTPAFDEYIVSQREQLLDGRMHPSIHNTLLHYMNGKPIERIEVKDTTTDSLSEVSAEELRARALALASRIVVDTPQDDDVTIN